MESVREMWEERFSGETFAYGTEPNEFFRKVLNSLEPGRILLPADGEARNGVYAATKGWDVHCVDFSQNARKKAVQLANLNNVRIHYLISDLFTYDYPQNRFDAAALIFVHMPPEKRKQLHIKVRESVKSGGCVFLEAFSGRQIRHVSGGPRDESLLFSKENLEEDFKDFTFSYLKEEEVVLREGLFHQGKASVVRMIGTKP